MKTPRSIIILVADLHLNGGGERVAVDLANLFSEKGNKVTILSVSKKRNDSHFHTNKEIEIKYLNIDLYNRNKIFSKIKSIFLTSKYFKRITEPTIVMAIGNYPSLLISMIGKRDNIKTIGCQHLAYSGINGVWKILRQIYFKKLGAIVSLTEFDKKNYKKLNQNTYTIQNSLPFASEIKANLDNKQILFVGRMEKEKGYDLMIEVAKKITKLYPDWKFRIIGSGYLQREILSNIERENLSSFFTHIQSTQNIEKEYLESSIFLMTSRTEGLPMVLIEAQSFGLPVVSFDCETGPADIISDGESGFLIKCFDIEDMVQKLSILCSDKKSRLEMGKVAIEEVKKFEPGKILDKWEDLFNKILHVN